MGIETIDIELISNYRDVGFGMVADTRLVPLMRLGVWRNPSLGIVSMKDFLILLGLLFVWYHLCTVDEGDFQVDIGKDSLSCSNIVIFCLLISAFILLILHFLGG